MCLISKWRFPKKAEEDIVCYKVLEKVEDKYRSPYFDDNFVDTNKIYKAKGISLSIKDAYEKGEGYIHVFSNVPNHYQIDNFRISRSKLVIFKCIIPKGTKYHMSRNKRQYCAKEIKFIQIY